MEQDSRILVTGAGGFIGGHLVKKLLDDGYTNICCVDIKPFKHWYQLFPNTTSYVKDLKDKKSCYDVCYDVDYVFNMAADMGGMGFIENNKALCMLSVLINTHLLLASRDMRVKRYFYSSSACVYAADKQTDVNNPGLKESDAYPAMAEDGYGWEKLFSERMCRHFMEDFGLETRVARYHNVYGPYTSYNDGREKAPAAICRKVIESQLNGTNTIEIWGDGTRTRSFMYIDDCLTGILKIMNSDIKEPINLGSKEMVSINQLVDIVEGVAGVKVNRTYKLDAPLGVMGRSSDNTMINDLLHWEPSIPLKDGIAKTYEWIYSQMVNQ